MQGKLRPERRVSEAGTPFSYAPVDYSRVKIRTALMAQMLTENTPMIVQTSTQDLISTRAIVQAGQVVDVDVLDNLVLRCGKFGPMKSRGPGS